MFTFKDAFLSLLSKTKSLLPFAPSHSVLFIEDKNMFNGIEAAQVRESLGLIENK
jgi:hypothetical protein